MRTQRVDPTYSIEFTSPQSVLDIAKRTEQAYTTGYDYLLKISSSAFLLEFIFDVLHWLSGMANHGRYSAFERIVAIGHFRRKSAEIRHYFRWQTNTN